MALLTLNNRPYYLNADKVSVTETSAGRYEVTYDDRTFTVIGGRRSGGSSKEWFCHHPLFFGDAYLPAKSMIEAIRLGVQY